MSPSVFRQLKRKFAPSGNAVTVFGKREACQYKPAAQASVSFSVVGLLGLRTARSSHRGQVIAVDGANDDTNLWDEFNEFFFGELSGGFANRRPVFEIEELF